VKILHEDLE